MWTDANTYADSDLAQGWKSICTHYVGIDYGTSNATAFLDTWDDGTTYWIDKEYYYDGRKERKQKTDEEYANDLDAFLGGSKDTIIVLDPSAASFATLLRNRGYLVRPADNDVQDGLRVVATLMNKAMIRVRADACPNLIREISGYVWDEKAKARGEEAPLKVDDHACDALRYVIKTTASRWRVACRP